jgi:hypothetical protein
MNINPIFEGNESDNALLGDATKMFNQLAHPQTPIDTIVNWVAHWVKNGGPTLGKPTKYESRTGKF